MDTGQRRPACGRPAPSRLWQASASPDEVLSLVLAEVPGGKRRGWKVLPHQSKATLGGEGRRRPRLRTVHDFPDQAPDRPLS
jgi:hypothetical protein